MLLMMFGSSYSRCMCSRVMPAACCFISRRILANCFPFERHQLLWSKSSSHTCIFGWFVVTWV